MRRHYRPIFLFAAENPARSAANRKPAAVFAITDKEKEKRPA
jgi:hypothetical protein